MRVVLGNRDHIIRVTTEDGDTAEPGVKGKQATVVDFPDGTSLMEALTAVTHPQGVWAYQAKAGATPAWVASDTPGLAAVLAEHFGGIEVRDLADPYDPATRDSGHTSGGGGSGGRAASFLPTLLHLPLVVLVLGLVYRATMALLKTNYGNDFVSQQLAGTPSATAVAKWVALSANTTTPTGTDTALTGEITTTGGGLVRKQGTYAHTTGAASYTVTTVFTANGSDVLPVTVGKRGVFESAASTSQIFSTLITPTATLSAVGDQLTITDTVTL